MPDTTVSSSFDVDIEIKFCGFSPFADVHLANYDWGSVPGLYAVVGHEITGVVTKIGDNVKANLKQSLNFVLLINFHKKQWADKENLNNCKDKAICFYFCRTMDRQTFS